MLGTFYTLEQVFEETYLFLCILASLGKPASVSYLIFRDWPCLNVNVSHKRCTFLSTDL